MNTIPPSFVITGLIAIVLFAFFIYTYTRSIENYDVVSNDFVSYGDKIHIGKSTSPKHRLQMNIGTASEVYDQTHEPLQLVIQSVEGNINKSGCVFYGDKIRIARHMYPDYRLNMNVGQASEVQGVTGETSQLVIQSTSGKTGCVRYGDEIYIARHMYPDYRLRLYDSQASEVKDGSDESFRLTIQSVNPVITVSSIVNDKFVGSTVSLGTDNAKYYVSHYGKFVRLSSDPFPDSYFNIYETSLLGGYILTSNNGIIAYQNGKYVVRKEPYVFFIKTISTPTPPTTPKPVTTMPTTTPFKPTTIPTGVNVTSIFKNRALNINGNQVFAKSLGNGLILTDLYLTNSVSSTNGWVAGANEGWPTQIFQTSQGYYITTAFNAYINPTNAFKSSNKFVTTSIQISKEAEELMKSIGKGSLIATPAPNTTTFIPITTIPTTTPFIPITTIPTTTPFKPTKKFGKRKKY
jgi:hypothetical protein